MITTPRFFGGDASHLFKHVEPLPCANFKEFFDTQLRAPIRSQHTAAEFTAMSEAGKKQVKFVRYFTPSSFAEKSKGGYLKNNANVKAVNLLCLDIDPEKVKDPETGKWVETGDYPAARLIKNPQRLREALDGLNFALYTTINHTPEAARARLVVEADNLPPEHYAEAVNHIAALIGLPSVTTESKTISQAMFRPTIFADTDLNFNHPVVDYFCKGTAFDPSVLVGIGATTMKPGKPPKQASTDFFDGIEYLKQSVYGVELKDAKEAISALSPDCSQDDWIRCAMALRHQFPSQDEEAFALFDSWSSEGRTYEGEEKTRYRWDHTSATPSNRLPTTMRTIFKLAKEAGWDCAETNQKLFARLTTWLKGCTTLEDLLDRGFEKIVVSPLLGSAYETPLIDTVKKQAKSVFGFTYSVAELKKHLKTLQSEAKEKQRQKDSEEKPTPLWARGLVYLSGLERVYRTETCEVLTKSSFDSSYGVKLLPNAQELQERGDTSLQAKLTPIVRPQDYILNELEIPRVYDLTYDPANPDDVIVVKGKKRFVNTYTKSYAKADRKTAVEAGRVILKHAALLIAEPEHQRRLIDFIAFMVQNPGKKVRWAFLIQSAQGNGKGLLAKALRGVFGRGNIKTVDPEAIFSPFNDWAVGTQLSILNEIRVTGHSRHDVMNKLKEPISDDHVSINQKFKPNEEFENVTNYLIFTNHKDAIAVEQRERRYFVVFSPIQTEKDTDRLMESGALEPLQKLVDSAQFGGLRAFFEDWELSPRFCPDSPPPKTEYFYQMADHSKTDIEKLLEGVLEEGQEPLVQSDIISSSQLLRMLESETNQKISPKVLGSILINKGFKRHSRLSILGVKHQVWVDPDSAVADLNVAKILEKRITLHGEELL